MAHDETNSVGVGDVVRIEACRPISKTKKFAVAEVLAKSKFGPKVTSESASLASGEIAA